MVSPTCAIQVLCTLILSACFAGLAIATEQSNQSSIEPSPFDFVISSEATSQGGHAACSSGLVSVKVTSTNLKFTIQPPEDQFGATQIIQELLQNNSTLVPDNTVGTATVSQSFSISGVLCRPAATSNPFSIQILTHGVGLDKTYWDIAPNYSYVDAAAQAGYATFTYDRLGSGESEKPDPINIVQSPLEVELLHQLVQHLKPAYKNVICGAHSFGTTIQANHDAKYPSDCAAVIATGSSDTLQFLPSTQLSNTPAIANRLDKFQGLSSGYLIDPNQISFHQPFFRYPFFNLQGMLDKA